MKTVLQHYTFHAGGGTYFLALGIGSLLNHNDPPNVDYRIHRQEETIHFVACRDIAVGDELFIFYGPNVWFHDTRKQQDETGNGGAAETSNRAQGENEQEPLPFFCDDEDGDVNSFTTRSDFTKNEVTLLCYFEH